MQEHYAYLLNYNVLGKEIGGKHDHSLHRTLVISQVIMLLLPTPYNVKS